MVLPGLRLVLIVLLSAIFAEAYSPAQSGITAVLPNGREIHPAGNWIPLAPYPFALALTADGSKVAIPSIGFPFALNLIENPGSANSLAVRLPAVDLPASRQGDTDVEVHAGLAWSPDGSILWVATGDSGKIRAYRTTLSDGSPQLTADFDIPLDGPTGGKSYSESFATTLLTSQDGKTLYALDQGNWRVVIIDAETRQRLASIPTGRYPMNLALSPDGARLYVTNTGIFEYTAIPGADAKDPLHTGLHFPPFGYPSQAARDGVSIEGKKIPGLGDENSLDGSSLWTYDVRDPSHPSIIGRLHLGTRISDEPRSTIGGSAPTGVAADPDAVYVTLAHDDAVVKVSPDGAQTLVETHLSPFSSSELGPRFLDAQGRPLRGIMPSGANLPVTPAPASPGPAPSISSVPSPACRVIVTPEDSPCRARFPIS
jgi:YVTN family beta-propeller protein